MRLTDAEREVCRLCGDSWPRTLAYWHRHPETADRLDTRCIPCALKVKMHSRAMEKWRAEKPSL